MISVAILPPHLTCSKPEVHKQLFCMVHTTNINLSMKSPLRYIHRSHINIQISIDVRSYGLSHILMSSYTFSFIITRQTLTMGHWNTLLQQTEFCLRVTHWSGGKWYPQNPYSLTGLTPLSIVIHSNNSRPHGNMWLYYHILTHLIFCPCSIVGVMVWRSN